LKKILVFCVLIAFGFAGDQLIGTEAPDWNNTRWINSHPLSVKQLRGKVVLVRFFMESNCPMCRGSAPYLNELYSAFKDKGLVVIGMYTPKPQPRTTETSVVEQYVKDYGFDFPVAVDDEWATLKKFWLDRIPDAEYTSVSFLIDQKGIIRYIHPGGLYTKEDVALIRKSVVKLLE
jgi:peroxiredoxin